MMPIPSSGGGDAACPAACSVHLLEGEETAKDEGDPGKTNPPHSGWVSYSLFPRPQGECFRRWYFNLVCYNWTAFMISTWFCMRYLIWCSMWKKNPGDAQTQERALSLSLFPWMNPSWGSRERWERWQSGCLLDCICKEHVRDEGESGKSAFPSTPTSMADRDKGPCWVFSRSRRNKAVNPSLADCS